MNTDQQRGFTFLEVLVVVAIVAIITAVALPSYLNSVNNQKRLTLQTVMMQMAQRLEDYKVVNGDYGATNSNATYASNALLMPAVYGSVVYPRNTAEKQLYTLSIHPAGTAGTGSSATSTSWEIVATPTGALTGTGTVKLNDQGWRCWKKATTPICTPSSTSNWDDGNSL